MGIISKIIPQPDPNQLAGKPIRITKFKDGEILVYNSVTKRWEATTISGGDSLPDQTGNNGKFLSTDGTDPAWTALAGGGGSILLATTYDPIATEGLLICSQYNAGA